jgi:hypothetical protein
VRFLKFDHCDIFAKPSRDPFFELSGRPRLDNRQTFFRLVTSRYARLEKSIILASAVSYQNHPQRIVNVGGIAAMLQLANNAIFHALKSLGYGGSSCLSLFCELV